MMTPLLFIATSGSITLILFLIIQAAINFVVYGNKRFANPNDVYTQRYNAVYPTGKDTAFLYVKSGKEWYSPIHKLPASSSPLFKYWIGDGKGIVVRGSKLSRTIDQRFKEVGQ